MLKKPSKALLAALRNFVLDHEIFVEAREFDDGLIFVRRAAGQSRKRGPRRHFKVFLRRGERRVQFYTLSCGSEDIDRLRVDIDLPEKVLLRPAAAAIEYEDCGRDRKRYAARFPKDADVGRALFGYVRSESRILRRLLGEPAYEELLQLVRRRRGLPISRGRERPAR